MNEPERQSRAAFEVTGLFARTNNNREMIGADGRIGPLWGAFSQLPQQALSGSDAEETYAVYTNYESDFQGDYDIVIGKKTGESAAAPPEMRRVSIPAATYFVFRAADRSPDAIVGAWKSVYDYFGSPEAPTRAYIADFEEYGAGGVRLWVGVKAPV